MAKPIYFLTVNYYSTNLITKLIASLPNDQHSNYKVVIINNSPFDDSLAKLQSEYIEIIDSNENLGFGRACNLGIRWIFLQDPQAIIWLINPDAYFIENPLAKVNNFFTTHPEISLLGTIIQTPKHQVWFAGGRYIPATGSIISQDLLTNTNVEYVLCDWVSGCSLLVNLGKFANYPQFDPAYFLYYEDFDFCRRYAQQKHLIAVTKQFGVLHQPSSITDRYVFRKAKHSTYSYLLTLEKYTHKTVFLMRLIRLCIWASILMMIKPQVAFAKFVGLFSYYKDIRHDRCLSPVDIRSNPSAWK